MNTKIKNSDELIRFAAQRSSEDNSCADATDGDFIGRSFQGLNLSGIDFTGSSLVCSDFSGCDLSGAFFVECDVTSTNFSLANLTGALFQRTIATSASFYSVHSKNLQFTECTLKNTNFGDFFATDLEQFTSCDFRGAWLSRRLFLRVSALPNTHINLKTARVAN